MKMEIAFRNEDHEERLEEFRKYKKVEKNHNMMEKYQGFVLD